MPLAIAIYSSTQSSEIQSGHFSIHGSATAGAEADGWFYGADAGSYASSDFEVVFEVSTPKLFSLAGTLARSGASLQLDRDGAPYLSFDPVGNDVITVSEDGILEPGAYTLTVNAMAYAQTYFEQFSSFDIDFFMESPVAVDEMSWGQVKSLFR